MAYHWLLNSITCDAPEMHENYMAVANGTRYPNKISTTGMLYTTGVYDLGSSDYYWKNVYCNTLDINSSLENTWFLLSSRSIASATNRILFGDTSGSSALNGDTDIEYEIICKFVYDESTIIAYYIHCGTSAGADTASNYGTQYYQANSTTSAAGRAGFSGFLIGQTYNDTTTSQVCLSKTFLHVKSGYERTAITSYNIEGTGNYIFRQFYATQIWNNTSDTITNIVITAATTTGIGVGSRIELWARR